VKVKVRNLIELNKMLDGKIKWRTNEDWIKVIGELLRDHLVEHHSFVVVEEEGKSVG